MRVFIFVFLLYLGFSCDFSTPRPANFEKLNDLHKTHADSLLLKKKIRMVETVSKQDRAHIQAQFNRFIRRRRFNGSILVVKDNEVIVDTTRGYANVRRRIPLKDTSAIQLASISKPITAAVVLSLIEEGRLSLQDSVRKFLPRLPEEYDRITIQMLLSHQSGLTQYYYYCDHVLEDKNFVLGNDSLIEVINCHNPGFCGRPGRRFKYCNTNYALLASIVEEIEGKSFHAVVNERIIVPSGMEDSFLLDLKGDSLPQNIVMGNNEWNRPMEFDYLDGIVGDKGFFSTTHDLLKFDQYFFNCLMINDSLMQKAFSLQTKKDRNGSGYGLGWRIRYDKELGKIIYHPGWWRGNRHLYFKIPSKGYTVILLSNSLRGSRYNLNDLLSIFYDVK